MINSQSYNGWLVIAGSQEKSKIPKSRITCLILIALIEDANGFSWDAAPL